MNYNKPIEVKSDQLGLSTEWFDAKYCQTIRETHIVDIGDRLVIFAIGNSFGFDSYNNRWFIRNKKETVTVYEWVNEFHYGTTWAQVQPKPYMQRDGIAVYERNWNKTGRSKEIEL